MPGFFTSESRISVAESGEWSRAAVLANLTNSALGLLGIVSVSVRVAPVAITVVGLSLSSSIVAAGGNLTATLFVDGSATSLVATLAAGQSIAIAQGNVSVSAGGTYAVRITTPAGWTSITLDLVALVFTR